MTARGSGSQNTGALGMLLKEDGPMSEKTQKFYCVKCKGSIEVPEDQTRVETAGNGRRMRKGKCPTCGTNVTRIMGKND